MSFFDLATLRRIRSGFGDVTGHRPIEMKLICLLGFWFVVLAMGCSQHTANQGQLTTQDIEQVLQLKWWQLHIEDEEVSSRIRVTCKSPDGQVVPLLSTPSRRGVHKVVLRGMMEDHLLCTILFADGTVATGRNRNIFLTPATVSPTEVAGMGAIKNGEFIQSGQWLIVEGNESNPSSGLQISVLPDKDQGGSDEPG